MTYLRVALKTLNDEQLKFLLSSVAFCERQSAFNYD